MQGQFRYVERPTTPARPQSDTLQRKCACGNHTIAGGACGACSKGRKSSLQRAAISREPVDGYNNAVPSIVHEVLRSPGQPLMDRFRSMFSGGEE